MNATLGFILAVGILLPVGLGLGLGAYRAVQSPAFLAEAGALILKTLMPILAQYVATRNTPEVEAQMHKVTRRAGEWDNFRKKERER